MSNLEIRFLMGVTCFCLSFFGFALIVFMRRLRDKPKSVEPEIYPERIRGEDVYAIARRVDNKTQYMLKDGYNKWTVDANYYYLDNLEKFEHAKIAGSFIRGYVRSRELYLNGD